jgi:glycine cleavage system transcriptional repressor
MPFFVITAVGVDRPGIVAEFTGVLYRQGCNLEDSTMTRLRDQFAMMLVVQAPDEVLTSLETGLHVVASQLGLSVSVRPLAEGAAEPEPAPERFILRVYGADRPGIVNAATSLLARHALNITDLNTRILPGAKGPVYVLLLEVEAPTPDAGTALEPELARLREELGMDISFERLDEEAL